MGSVTYTDLRANLARYMDEAVESRKPLVVTRQGGRGNVVMMSEGSSKDGRRRCIFSAAPGTPNASSARSAPLIAARRGSATSCPRRRPVNLEGPLH